MTIRTRYTKNGTPYAEQAVAAFHQALELNPNYSLAWGTLGSVLAIAGDAEESIKASQVALRSNPGDPSNFFRFTSLAEANYMLGRYEEAMDWARIAVNLKRDWFRGHHWVIGTLARLGRLEEARAAALVYLDLFPGGSLADAERYPQKSTAHRNQLLDDLRLAGLPTVPS
jgi:tetratricopeptide (TPR) repeat protein